MTGALYMRPILCKYCNSLFDFPTFTSDIKEKDVPIRTRICCGCLVKMRQDENLQDRRQVRNASKSSTDSFHMSDIKSVKTEPGTDDDDESDVKRTTSTSESNNTLLSLRPVTGSYTTSESVSARTSTETTETHMSSKQDHVATIRQSGSRSSSFQATQRRTMSDIHSLLN